MVMNRSISVDASGWCWMDGFCWMLRQNTSIFFLTQGLVRHFIVRSTHLPFDSNSLSFSRPWTELSVAFVNTVLILHGTRACPSGEICTAFLNKRTWINKLRLFERTFTRYYRNRNRMFCVAFARPRQLLLWCLASQNTFTFSVVKFPALSLIADIFSSKGKSDSVYLSAISLLTLFRC